MPKPSSIRPVAGCELTGDQEEAGTRTRGELGRAKPSQPLKLAPLPQTRRTYVALPHMSYHRKFLPVGVSVTHVPVLLSREHQRF